MTLRRDFLSMTTGAVAARTVLPLAASAEVFATVARTPTQPDAELLRLGQQFDQARAVEQAVWAAFEAADGCSDDHPLCIKAMALAKTVGALVDQIGPMPAWTVDGLLVKTRAIAWCQGGEAPSLSMFDGYWTKPGSYTTAERLTVSLLGDLHAMGAPS